LVYSSCERAIGFDGELDVSCDFLWLCVKKVAEGVGIFVERGLMETELSSCNTIPGLKRTNMLLRTELGLMGAL
jgi:hypothetical protein